MSQNNFPPGTPVRIRQTSMRRGQPLESVTVGVVESWEEQPWSNPGKNNPRVAGMPMARITNCGSPVCNCENMTAKLPR